MMDEQAMSAQMSAEMADMDRPMELILRPHSVLILVALVQLALRHPSVDGRIRDMGETLVAASKEYFANCPTVVQTIQLGDAGGRVS
jgi:hypothetical protein